MLKELKLWIASLFKKKEEEVREEGKEEKQAVATYHAKQRLEQRHGIVMTQDMVNSMVSDIQNKKAEFLKDTRDQSQSWIVAYEGKKYRVIYHTVKETIITIYSGTKRRKRKPSRKRKVRVPTGRVMKNHSYKDKRIAKKQPYKRNKKVEYEEAM